MLLLGCIVDDEKYENNIEKVPVHVIIEAISDPRNVGRSPGNPDKEPKKEQKRPC